MLVVDTDRANILGRGNLLGTKFGKGDRCFVATISVAWAIRNELTGRIGLFDNFLKGNLSQNKGTILAIVADVHLKTFVVADVAEVEDGLYGVLCHTSLDMRRTLRFTPVFIDDV